MIYYGVVNPGPGLRQTQKCGGFKSINEVLIPPSNNWRSSGNTKVHTQHKTCTDSFPHKNVAGFDRLMESQLAHPRDRGLGLWCLTQLSANLSFLQLNF